MQTDIQVGSIFMKHGSLTSKLAGPDNADYSGNWSLMKLINRPAFDRQLVASGSTFFFMAGEVKASFFGGLGLNRVRNGLKSILRKVEAKHFNGLEVTGMATKHFLGIPYSVITAHSRHAQRSCYLEGVEQRSIS